MTDHGLTTSVGVASQINARESDPDRSDNAIPARSTDPAGTSTAEPKPRLRTPMTLNLQADHRRLLKFVTTLILITLAAEWIILTTQRPEPLPIQRGPGFLSQFQIEVNSAKWVEWMQLEGIGPSLAHRIVADRKLNGPFTSIDDLTRVPGIGRTTLDRIRRWLTIRHDLSDSNLSETSHAGQSGRQPANNQRQSTAF